MATLREALALVLLLAVAGCASLPEDYARTESSAIDDYQSTTLGARYVARELANPGESGFALVRYGRRAFNARIGIIDLAEKSVDLQVYIWDTDETGRMLAERLLRAADRGVRVRLLVDDLGTGATDAAMAALDAHPNIELRLFNPFANRGFNALDFLTDLDRVNHRMHNKSLIVDNSFAVVGGRNIANHYFSVNPETNFRDLDIAAIGPVVRDISAMFDHFWAGESAVPVSALVEEDYDPHWRAQTARELREQIAAGHYPYPLEEEVKELLSQLDSLQDSFVWAPGTIVWDDPQGIDDEAQAGTPIIERLHRKLDTVQESLIIESAYFVVGEGGLERIRELIDRGVRVRILTNSLVSNDVLAAHAGHANYRRELLQAGAEMYELRPDSTVIQKTWVGESRAGLHTKALVFDGQSLFAGSFNLDPRSANINTEAGLYVESPELAAQLIAYMDEGIAPQQAYRVVLNADGDLEWIAYDDGVEVRYDQDPGSTFWQRFQVGFIGLLPIESQL